MTSGPEQASPVWVGVLLTIVAIVLLIFGLIAAFTGEWDVALLDFAIVGSLVATRLKP